MQRIVLSLVISLYFTQAASAQEDYTWWNELHQWDGVTPWNQYLTIAPKYFGPNALPVPIVRNGRVDSLFQFEVAAGGHFSNGDNTQDAVVRFIAPVCNGRVALEATVVPFEYYQLDDVTRDVRAVRDRDGKGHAGGDIHFSTNVSLLRDHTSLPDIALEIALRTASGTRLGAARYTDAPGYHMDVSFGKNLESNSRIFQRIRLYGFSGFYSYQTFDVQQLQNDCILYGIGVDVSCGRVVWTNQLAGYSGYKHNGDQPVNYRSSLRLAGKNLDGILRVQIGLRDFEYRSVHAGVIFKFPANLREY